MFKFCKNIINILHFLLSIQIMKHTELENHFKRYKEIYK